MRHQGRHGAVRGEGSALVVLVVSVAVMLGTPAAALVVAQRHDAAPASIGDASATQVAEPSPPPPARASRSTGARPAALVIPALGVSTSIVPSGVTPAGGVAVPENIDLTGWYRYGARPADSSGSTVVVGHRDGVRTGEGALFSLGRLKIGDRVVVVDSAWTRWEYRVVARQSIRKDAVPYDKLFSTGGPPRLTLVSCGGRFLADQGSYEDNVVVTAVPEPGTGR